MLFVDPKLSSSLESENKIAVTLLSRKEVKPGFLQKWEKSIYPQAFEKLEITESIEFKQ